MSPGEQLNQFLPKLTGFGFRIIIQENREVSVERVEGSKRFFEQDNRYAMMADRIKIFDDIEARHDQLDTSQLPMEEHLAIIKGYDELVDTFDLINSTVGTPEIHPTHMLFMRRAGNLLLLLESKLPERIDLHNENLN